MARLGLSGASRIACSIGAMAASGSPRNKLRSDGIIGRHTQRFVKYGPMGGANVKFLIPALVAPGPRVFFVDHSNMAAAASAPSPSARDFARQPVSAGASRGSLSYVIGHV